MVSIFFHYFLAVVMELWSAFELNQDCKIHFDSYLCAVKEEWKRTQCFIISIPFVLYNYSMHNHGCQYTQTQWWKHRIQLVHSLEWRFLYRFLVRLHVYVRWSADMQQQKHHHQQLPPHQTVNMNFIVGIFVIERMIMAVAWCSMFGT